MILNMLLAVRVTQYPEQSGHPRIRRQRLTSPRPVWSLPRARDANLPSMEGTWYMWLIDGLSQILKDHLRGQKRGVKAGKNRRLLQAEPWVGIRKS